MSASYRSTTARWWQTLGDGEVGLGVALIVLGVWLRRPLPVVAVGSVLVLLGVRRIVCLVAVVVGIAGSVLSIHAWNEVRPDQLGSYSGFGCLVSDPAPVAGATVVVVELDGERFEAWLRGSAGRRVAGHLAGECARITGTRQALHGSDAKRAAARHVVGGLTLESAGDWSPGTELAQASNRVRRLFADGASELRSPDDALFAGLVIGDDRNEPAAMIEQFRGSGLSHLTAVSGQNVAFMLAAAGPLLRRLRPWGRWVATLAVIGWFVVLTRFEPSVLRAAVMAGIASTGVVLGREKPPARVLALAIGLLVLVDPFLVWSVGFWLSVSATAGVVLLASRLAERIPGPDWLTLPAGVTLGAQAGIAPISLLVFGRLPLVSLPANLLAVPAAGGVMLYGLPAGLVAGTLHRSPLPGLAGVVQLPSALGTHWVAAVAALGARLEPPLPIVVIGWLGVVVFLATRIGMARRRRVCEGVC
ncbi:MAG: comEC [Ilumatobacteraceae bacterium]|nr:comEC [Ilumatobacteraceae bacterium]